MASAAPREMQLKEIERSNWWVARALTGATGLWSTPSFTLSVLAGGLVMALNFCLWRLLIQGLLHSQWNLKAQLGGVIFKVMAKFFTLLGVTALLFLYVGIHPLGFFLGSTNLLVSAVLVGVNRSQFNQAFSRFEVRSR